MDNNETGALIIMVGFLVVSLSGHLSGSFPFYITALNLFVAIFGLLSFMFYRYNLLYA